MIIPVFLFGVVNPMGTFLPGPHNQSVVILYACILAVSLAIVLTANIMLLSTAHRIDTLDDNEKTINNIKKNLVIERHEVDLLRIQYGRLVSEARQSISIYRKLLDDEEIRIQQAKKPSNKATETASGGT